ncbi:MAG TPA: O-antigen ligase family protein [Candidatus Saccharimonadales bacterium]|nr:O-antigen ligase family protein [Candidatus Saccharimonadales bacterium]
MSTAPHGAAPTAQPAAPATDWWVVGPLSAGLLCLPLARAGTSAASIVLALVLAWRLVRRELQIPRELTFGIACFLITWGLSISGSLDDRASLRDWLGWVAVCLPVLAVAGRRAAGPLPAGLQAAWISVSLLLGAWVVAEMWLGLHLLSGTFPGRVSLPMLPNPNATAQYLLLLFAWCFAFALRARGRAAGWWHAAWVPAALLLSGCHTRASWPAFAAVVGFSSRRARRPILGWTAVAVFVAGNWLLRESLWQRVVDLTALSDESIQGRVQGWVVALRMIARRPFTGEGLGAWKTAYGLLRSPDFRPLWPHAHNFYLHTLAETGFLGLLGFGALLWGFRRVWWAGWSDPEPAAEELAMTAALLGTAMVALFDVTWGGEAGYAFLVLAAFALRRRSLTPAEVRG